MSDTCAPDFCDRPVHAMGLCHQHRRQQKAGKVLTPIKVYEKGHCTGPECTRRAVAQRLCDTHWKQQFRYGKELTPIRPYGGGVQSNHSRVLKKWNLTESEYAEILEGQGGGCAICGKLNTNGRRLSVDHDHECCSGDVRKACGSCNRALLCGACNFAIGAFKDDPELMLKAAEYVRYWRGDGS